MWYCYSCRSENLYFEVGERIFVDTPVLVCYYYAFVLSILEYCIVLQCGGQLLDVTFNFSTTRCIQWPIFQLIRVYCCGVINIMLLVYLCCTWLIQTQITVCSVSFHLHQPEFDIPDLRLLFINWSLKYQGVECPNLQSVSCQPRSKCGMTFPALCLTLEC